MQKAPSPEPFPKPLQRIQLGFAELVAAVRSCPRRTQPRSSRRHCSALPPPRNLQSLCSSFLFWIFINVFVKPGPNYSPLLNPACSKSLQSITGIQLPSQLSPVAVPSLPQVPVTSLLLHLVPASPSLGTPGGSSTRGEKRKEKETKSFGCKAKLQSVLECRFQLEFM